MAKRVANILRVVLSLHPGAEGGSEPGHLPLASHIDRLPMPEDYALEELRGLTQSYLRQIIVSLLATATPKTSVPMATEKGL